MGISAFDSRFMIFPAESREDRRPFDFGDVGVLFSFNGAGVRAVCGVEEVCEDYTFVFVCLSWGVSEMCGAALEGVKGEL